jgi:predicted RNase H-like nuclease
MPIGLAAGGPRRADVDARRRLGPRRSSVFPAPARAVLAASTYTEACDLSRTASGKAISKQLFYILPRIREVDQLVTPRRQQHLFEMSPELSLAVMDGAPMAHAKRTEAGRDERARVLGAAFGRAAIARAIRHAPRGAKIDDVLDAFAGAWTAQRCARSAHLQLGGDVDERGLRMEIVA